MLLKTFISNGKFIEVFSATLVEHVGVLDGISAFASSIDRRTGKKSLNIAPAGECFANIFCRLLQSFSHFRWFWYNNQTTDYLKYQRFFVSQMLRNEASVCSILAISMCVGIGSSASFSDQFKKSYLYFIDKLLNFRREFYHACLLSLLCCANMGMKSWKVNEPVRSKLLDWYIFRIILVSAICLMFHCNFWIFFAGRFLRILYFQYPINTRYIGNLQNIRNIPFRIFLLKFTCSFLVVKFSIESLKYGESVKKSRHAASNSSGEKSWIVVSKSKPVIQLLVF